MAKAKGKAAKSISRKSAKKREVPDVGVGQAAVIIGGKNEGTEGYIHSVVSSNKNDVPEKVVFVVRNNPGNQFEESYSNIEAVETFGSLP